MSCLSEWSALLAPWLRRIPLGHGRGRGRGRGGGGGGVGVVVIVVDECEVSAERGDGARAVRVAAPCCAAVLVAHKKLKALHKGSAHQVGV